MSRLAHRDKLAVIFTTHDPDHALAIADGVMLMQDVANFTVGETGDVLAEELLRAVYGVEMRYVTSVDGDRTLKSFVHRRDLNVSAYFFRGTEAIAQTEWDR